MLEKNTPNSPALLRRLYAVRRSTLPPMGSRATPLMFMAITLAVGLISVLLSLSWIQRSEVDYLRNSAGVHLFDDLPWTVTLPSGTTASPSAPAGVTLSELAKISVTGFNDHNPSFTIATEIPATAMQGFKGGTATEPVVLGLPEFPFSKARVETTWTQPRDFVQGEKLILVFLIPEGGLAAENYRLTITLSPLPSQKTLINSPVNQVPLFLAGLVKYKKYEDFAAARRVGSGKQLADIGRIVLAMFSIFLFIFIDSSAECLALGIFMSLKAFGVVTSQRWFNDSGLPPELVTVLPQFLLSFADFMQLYFFTQLARLFPPKPLHWLAAGIVFGVLYTWGVNIKPTFGGINWSLEVWRWRNIMIGMACLACALPVARICWRDGNYHRTAALILASSGVIVQIVTPIVVDIQGVSDMLWFRTWYNLFEAHTPYVFALSTFINVSTLEQRVKALTGAAVQAKLIERELSLGREVQQALFQIPVLPPGISMAFSHEAARYVSGDLIYANHDPVNQTATALLCDVTGHGVQAAIKASICSALCESIWDGSRLRPGDESSRRLEFFYRRALGFFSRTQGSNEVLAMVGCEVSLPTRKITVYRANALLPMMITRQNRESNWIATVIGGPPMKPFDIQLPEELQSIRHAARDPDPIFFALFSDGLIDSSRTYKALVEWMNGRLVGESTLTAESLKTLILSFDRWHQTNDDRTLCVMGIAM